MREPSGRTRGRRTWGAVIALAVVGLVAAPLLTSLHGASDEPVRSALVGRPAPALAGTTLDGTSYDLAQAAGQVVLVNVWVSWCGPCRDELPLLAATRERLASAGMQVATIDTRDGPVAAQALLDELGVVDLPAVTTWTAGWRSRGSARGPGDLPGRPRRHHPRLPGRAITPEWVEQYVGPLVAEP